MYVYFVPKACADGKFLFKEAVRLYMYVYLVLKACAYTSKKKSGYTCMYTSFLKAVYVCILRLKACARESKEAFRLHTYVYFVLKACARIFF